MIVVDNASQDGSREYLENRFTGVKFCWNGSNEGFARANNRALALASGRYILFLNPDTIVPEDCFQKSLAFLEANPQAGALGVRMIDGSGHFLKESKRAYPSLLTSFYKLSGLSSLFPKSSVFSRYHLGHLDPYQDHEVDVLAGAFMMIKREVLDKTGGFDEAFFMYGEDIDLSYRIQRSGYRNYYFSGTTIIHFKGESTKRGSLNYVRMFYKAMIIFVQKHYDDLSARLFRILLQIAIRVRAGVSVFAGFIRHNGLPIVDAVNTLFSFIMAALLWSRYVKPETVYDTNLLFIAFPAFTLIFILISYYAGLYDRQQEKGRVMRSTILSVLAVLAIYSLLPERYRFSRGILLLGSFFSFLMLSLNRVLLRRWGMIGEEEGEKLGTVVVGTAGEYHEVTSIMQQAEIEERVLGRIAIDEDDAPRLTTAAHLDTFLRDIPLREIIFCQGGLSYQEIIAISSRMRTGLRMRIHRVGSGSIVGSDSSRALGKALSGEVQARIGTASARRFKRLFDVTMALFLLLGMPLNIFIVKSAVGLFRHAILVIMGKMSWVGYNTGQPRQLPLIRPGVLGPNGLPVGKDEEMEEGLQLLDHAYAREYTVNRDMQLVFRGYRWLGT